ncbi:MAG: Mth938-like domain-containing protein [Nitrososphaerales archaeon]
MIEAYRFGSITIDGKEYTRDVIILPSRILDNWWRKKGHQVQIEDLQEILKETPEILIIGTGYSGYMAVASEVPKHLSSRGIELISMKTEDAVKIFNKVSREKKAAAALHLTC